jgi:hypothetical protein
MKPLCGLGDALCLKKGVQRDEQAKITGQGELSVVIRWNHF